MKKSILFLACLLGLSVSQAQEAVDSLPDYGVGHKSSEMFRKFYHGGDFVHYLDNIDDRVTYQLETAGNYNQPDRLMFSVDGNSFRWNKYYLDGFRTDSRFFVGSSLVQPDMTEYSLDLDYFGSRINFTRDTVVDNSVSATFNVGNLGGITPFAESFLQLVSETATQRLYVPIEYRDHTQASGIVKLNYGIPSGDRKYMQQLYLDYGSRTHVNFNEEGIDSEYPESYFRMNLRGELPIRSNRLFDGWNYMLNIAQRDNLYSENYYDYDETARNNSYSLSVYGKKQTERHRYTSGLTFATNRIRHNDLDFSRNLIDQDGEGYEPWYPDGNMSELSYAVNYERKLTDWLDFRFDGYNSALRFSTASREFSNPVYMKMIDEPFRSLYVYDWKSRSFWSGLLENTAGLSAEKRLGKAVNFRAGLDFTLDGMLVKGETMVRPNWQFRAGFDIRPCPWFQIQVNAARNRVAYTWENITFFSDDYLSGDISYWQDLNGDHAYQENERTGYLASTGGSSHSAADGLRQQAFYTIDIPLYFRFGGHKISFQNTFKKYVNVWWTTLKNSDAVGHYVGGDTPDADAAYFLNGGSPLQYEVGNFPTALMDTDSPLNFLTNSPYYMSSLIKYEYENRKFYFSISWQSFMAAGASSLAHGPMHNDIGVLTEMAATPNNMPKLIGRYDQDRAYVSKMVVSYNITDNFSVSAFVKFKDGQPFSHFETRTVTDADGNTQLAMWRRDTRGINPMTGDFGCREDAFYNVDVKATYRGKIARKYPFEVQLYGYNLVDFGVELHEYCFIPHDYADYISDRFPLTLNIPRGLMLSFKMNLP